MPWIIFNLFHQFQTFVDVAMTITHVKFQFQLPTDRILKNELGPFWRFMAPDTINEKISESINLQNGAILGP